MEQNSWSMLSKLRDEEQKRRNEAPSREELETRHRAHAKKCVGSWVSIVLRNTSFLIPKNHFMSRFPEG